MSRDLSLRHDLLDQQILDCEEIPLGRVADLELAEPVGGGRPTIAALLTGSEALGERLGGVLGRVMHRTSARLRAGSGRAGPARVDVAEIDAIEIGIRLRSHHRDLRDVAELERWLADNFIGRIPGAGDARH